MHFVLRTISIPVQANLLNFIQKSNYEDKKIRHIEIYMVLCLKQRAFARFALLLWLSSQITLIFTSNKVLPVFLETRTNLLKSDHPSPGM